MPAKAGSRRKDTRKRRRKDEAAVSGKKSAGWREPRKPRGTPRKPISRSRATPNLSPSSELRGTSHEQAYFLHDDRASPARGGRSGRNGRSGSRGRGHHNSGTDKQGRSRRSGLGNAAASGVMAQSWSHDKFVPSPSATASNYSTASLQSPSSSRNHSSSSTLPTNEKGLELAKPNASSQSRQPASTGRRNRTKRNNGRTASDYSRRKEGLSTGQQKRNARPFGPDSSESGAKMKKSTQKNKNATSARTSQGSSAPATPINPLSRSRQAESRKKNKGSNSSDNNSSGSKAGGFGSTRKGNGGGGGGGGGSSSGTNSNSRNRKSKGTGNRTGGGETTKGKNVGSHNRQNQLTHAEDSQKGAKRQKDGRKISTSLLNKDDSKSAGELASKPTSKRPSIDAPEYEVLDPASIADTPEPEQMSWQQWQMAQDMQAVQLAGQQMHQGGAMDMQQVMYMQNMSRSQRNVC